MSKQIPLMDLMMLLAETQSNPIHVSGLMLFDKPEGRRGLVREIVDAYRSARPTPPFDCVPEFSGTHTPRWREAEHYDPRYHVQHIALPAGARHEDLLHLVGDLHETMLDRARPLFRVWVIDRVPGGRFALFVKMHHAIVDGVSGPGAAYIGVGLCEAAGASSPVLALTGEEPKSGLGLLGSLENANEPILNARSVATLSLPMQEMRAVGKRHDATLNDVTMAVIDAGVHRYLAEQDRPFEHRLVAMCPVSLREGDDASGGTRVSLEHGDFERHGEGAAEYRDAMGSEHGWPLMLQRFAEAAAG